MQTHLSIPHVPLFDDKTYKIAGHSTFGKPDICNVSMQSQGSNQPNQRNRGDSDEAASNVIPWPTIFDPKQRIPLTTPALLDRAHAIPVSVGLCLPNVFAFDHM